MQVRLPPARTHIRTNGSIYKKHKQSSSPPPRPPPPAPPPPKAPPPSVVVYSAVRLPSSHGKSSVGRFVRSLVLRRHPKAPSLDRVPSSFTHTDRSMRAVSRLNEYDKTRFSPRPASTASAGPTHTPLSAVHVTALHQPPRHTMPVAPLRPGKPPTPRRQAS